MPDKIKHICFDLDGTLIDSYKTIFKTTVKTLKYLDINETLNNEEFYKRIGKHFIDIFRELGIPLTDFEKFIGIYKSFYFDFINESQLYTGVERILKELSSDGIYISLLTTKSQEQADQIIDHFNLRRFFAEVMGRRNGIAVKPSGEPLNIICKTLGVSSLHTLMVGDSELDVNCGKNANAITCAAAYGYRGRELLLKENPDYIISKFQEIENIIKQ